MSQTFFDELKNDIHSQTNHNFHFESMNPVSKVWIKEMCNKIDKKLADMKDEAIQEIIQKRI